MFIDRLKTLFKRHMWGDATPRLYICSHNGVTGVVTASDYEREMKRVRKLKKWGRVIRPQVYPIFLFSDKNPASRSFRVGTLEDLKYILSWSYVEERSFELPPLNAPGHTPYGYEGMFEQVGRENTRHRVWTLQQAQDYLLHNKPIYTYNL